MLSREKRNVWDHVCLIRHMTVYTLLRPTEELAKTAAKAFQSWEKEDKKRSLRVACHMLKKLVSINKS